MSSVSWVAEKSAVELVVLLKNAYTALRDKEKGMMIDSLIDDFIACISLLENNMSLKSKYETLLDQLIFGNTLSDSQSHLVHPNDSETADEEMHFVSQHHSRQAFIETLERKNAEVQAMLEQAIAENVTAGHLNNKKTHQLETEIAWLRTSLENATMRIEELKEDQHHRQERTRRSDQRHVEQQLTEDQAFLNSLSERVSSLLTDNENLVSSKRLVEEKLSCAIRDLNQLRSQFEQFQLNQQGYHLLQEAYQRQFRHISELNESLEEHRQILSRLRERGMCATVSTTTLNDFTAPSYKQSLLGELEHAWQKKTPLNTPSLFDSKSKNIASMTERNLTCFYNAPGNYAIETFLSSAGITDCAVLESAVQFLSQSESGYQDSHHGSHSVLFDDLEMYGAEESQGHYDIQNLYPCLSDIHLTMDSLNTEEPSKGIISRILYHIRCLFRSVWRWCRFAMVLATAVMINIWQGPDAMLERSSTK
ncbi:hypothetical protein BDF14DRAFT_1720853 [Spinellus fusiger]|nr:hypothetical protein BDF14DRAFT_1720853 [Spinellus fusiger]